MFLLGIAFFMHQNNFVETFHLKQGGVFHVDRLTAADAAVPVLFPVQLPRQILPVRHPMQVPFWHLRWPSN